MWEIETLEVQEKMIKEAQERMAMKVRESVTQETRESLARDEIDGCIRPSKFKSIRHICEIILSGGSTKGSCSTPVSRHKIETPKP